MGLRLVVPKMALSTAVFFSILELAAPSRTDLQSVDLNCFVVPLSVLYFGQFKGELAERFNALFCYLKIDYLSYKF